MIVAYGYEGGDVGYVFRRADSTRIGGFHSRFEIVVPEAGDVLAIVRNHNEADIALRRLGLVRTSRQGGVSYLLEKPENIFACDCKKPVMTYDRCINCGGFRKGKVVR